MFVLISTVPVCMRAKLGLNLHWLTTTGTLRCIVSKLTGQLLILLTCIHRIGMCSALALQPESVNTLKSRATLLDTLGRAKEAIDDVSKAISRLEIEMVIVCLFVGLFLDAFGDGSTSMSCLFVELVCVDGWAGEINNTVQAT